MAEGYNPVVLVDLDGTLVDSVYHHVLAWDRAFAEAGYRVPLWRVHAAVGMGSARLIPWLLGEHPSEMQELKAAHTRQFLSLADGLRPTEGALALLADLERRQVPFRVATAANPEERETLLAALGRTDLPHTDAGDVDDPKPAPDLLLATCRELDARPQEATMLGDSPWDAEAAGQVGIRSILVRCGGFGDERLVAAGARAIVDNPRALVGRL